MAQYSIRRGLDLRLSGAPAPTLAELPLPDEVTVYRSDYDGLKPRLKVSEGSAVKRGTPLFCDKRDERFNVCAPAGGTVKKIVLGPRRSLVAVVIAVDRTDDAESFPRTPASAVRSLSREDVLARLLSSGLLSLIRQRPFSGMADPAAAPKSIFVNGMNTAPYQPDFPFVLKGRELAFHAGLDALTTLTKGKVHLCLDGAKDYPAPLREAKNVELHYFKGPHPAGNTSIHISRIDPIKPHDVVWTARAADVILIGELLIHGEWPATRIVALAGTGVKESARQYYRMRAGAPLGALLNGHLETGELRIIGGDLLSGGTLAADTSLRSRDTLITVIAEDRSRHLLGWMMPGFNLFSASRAYMSAWWRRGREWTPGTSQHGEPRPMVLTGIYDRYLPMNIMVDFLVRAVLANDTEEAIKLGILEVDPEDFALCAMVCPSKMDIVDIIRRGLLDIQKEGI